MRAAALRDACSDCGGLPHALRRLANTVNNRGARGSRLMIFLLFVDSLMGFVGHHSGKDNAVKNLC
jgi:hypothetical protein